MPAGISVCNRAVRMAPERATPTAPPNERKNADIAVAAPRSDRSTAFWIAVVKLGNVTPIPRPNTISDDLASGHAAAGPCADGQRL